MGVIKGKRIYKTTSKSPRVLVSTEYLKNLSLSIQHLYNINTLKKTGEFTVAFNKEAKAEYEIIETYEAGIVLEGSEVKALRNKQTVSFKDSFVRIENGEAWLYNLYIAPYRYATLKPPDPLRKRKLLLHKREILRLLGQGPAERIYHSTSQSLLQKRKGKGGNCLGKGQENLRSPGGAQRKGHKEADGKGLEKLAINIRIYLKTSLEASPWDI